MKSPRHSGREGGFTLVEMLVAMFIFSIVAALFGTLVTTSASSVEVTRQSNDLNEQARLAVNRISRELRQATEIQDVTYTGTQITGLTFDVDFNGNGVIDTNPSDPERLTYCWDQPGGRLMLTPYTGATQPCANPDALPMLSSDVSDLAIDLRASDWQFDAACSGTPDGIVTWQELDCAPLSAGVGNQNGQLDTIELRKINGIGITLTVLQGARQQVYKTQVELRNKP